MAPFGVLQPIFDNDRLPSTITRTYHIPIVPGKTEEHDEEYPGVESDEDVDEDEEGDSDEYEDVRKLQSRIRRAQSSATPAKRASSVAPPPVNPQYGELIPTPRQQGAMARRKPVLVDMDSEDEMIWNMKNLGYKDEPVAAELVKLGKIHYDPKTIATRYSRIKRTQASWQEQILDEDFSDYHEEEDIALAECLAATDALYKKDLEGIVNKRYTRVAELVNARIQRKKYTKINTKARITAIQNGTAIVPLEQDPEAHIRTARRTQEVLKCRRLRDEDRDRQRRERVENIERTKREAGELAQKRIVEEEERRIKRIEKEKKQAEAAVTREARLKIKQEEEETKAERAAMRAIESDRKKKALEEEKSTRRWDREQDKLARHAAKEQEALAKIEKTAEAAKAKIVTRREEQQRRELIRRHLRAAGILTAAPIEPARRRIERKAGVYSSKRRYESDEEDRKPNKAVLDEAVVREEEEEEEEAEDQIEEERGSTWSAWTAKGRAAARKSGKKVQMVKSHEVIDDTD